jgi:hypothetical protein
MARYTVGDSRGDRILKYLSRFGGLSSSQVATRLPNGVYKSGDGTQWVLIGYGGDPGREYAVLHQLVDYAKGQVVAQYPFLEDFREDVRKGTWVFVGKRP